MNSEDRGWLTRLRPKKVVIVLGSISLLVGVTIWLLRDTLRGGSFRAILALPQAPGITEGTPLTYRGVEVGKVLSLTPKPEGVAVEVKIWPKDRLIPSQSSLKPLEFEGKKVLNITPLASLPPDGVQAKPLDVNCDPQLIVCSTERSPNSDISLGSLLQAVNSIPDVNNNVANINHGVENIQSSLEGIDKISQDVSQLLGTLDKSQTPAKIEATLVSAERAAKDISQAANKIGRLSDTANSLLQEVKQTRTIARVNATLTSVEQVADRIDLFIAFNQNNVANTLTNIGQTSEELTITLRQLNAIAQEIQENELLQNVNNDQLLNNLATISANTAELSTKLLDFSTQFNDPQTILKLQQILDSARTMFENVNKITSDLDELTGNPQLREEIRKLIEGLSNLLSSTQFLQEQIAYNQSLEQAKKTLKYSLSSTPQLTTKTPSSVPTLLPVKPLRDLPQSRLEQDVNPQ